MATPTPIPDLISDDMFGLEYDTQLSAEIVHRYNTYHDRAKVAADVDAMRSEIQRLSSATQFASAALIRAGFTLCENGQWKPPLGKPVGPILDSLDAERETKTVLTGRIMDLAAAALPHMPVDEHLRIAGVKAINAALAVMEGRKP